MKSNEQLELGDLQWKRELEHALEALRKDNSNPLEAAVTFFASVCKLNDGLSWIVPMAPQRDADQVQELFVETIERMRAVMMDITALRDALPRRLVCRDSVISYGGLHSRSWSGVVLEAVNQLLLLTNSKATMPLSHLQATQTLDWRSYDSKFVAIQLEIEIQTIEESLSRIAPYSPGRNSRKDGGDPTNKDIDACRKYIAEYQAKFDGQTPTKTGIAETIGGSKTRMIKAAEIALKEFASSQ